MERLKIADVKKCLNATKSDITLWIHKFPNYLSPFATPPTGSTKEFTLEDVCVLQYIQFHWEENPDILNIEMGLNAGEHLAPPFIQLYFKLYYERQPIIRDTFEHIENPENYGLLANYAVLSKFELAQNFKKAAITLIEQAIKSDNDGHLLFPILFNLRHSIELFLKSIVKKEMINTHNLMSIFNQYKLESSKSFGLKFENLVKTLDDFDERGTAFRYYGALRHTDEHYLDYGLTIDMLNQFEKMVRRLVGKTVAVYSNVK